jgi:signal transduction histidine kinase
MVDVVSLGVSLYIILGLLTFLISWFVFFVNKYFLGITLVNYWTWGMLLGGVGIVMLYIAYYYYYLVLFVPLGFILLLIGQILYYLGFVTFVGKVMTYKWLIIPLIFVLICIIEVVFTRRYNVISVIFFIAIIVINLECIRFLLREVRMLSLFFKIPGLVASTFSVLMLTFSLICLAYGERIGFTGNRAIDVSFWIFICFTKLMYSFSMLLLCLGRVSLLAKQKSYEDQEIRQILTHDLSGAITSICTGLGMLNGKTKDSKFLINNLELTAHGTQELLSNVLRWLNKSDKVKKRLDSTTNVKVLFTKTLTFLSWQIKTKEINIVFLNQGDLEVRVDGLIIEAIIRNIISNAIKYSKPKGDIIIDYGIISGSIYITVEDFGIGMASDVLDNLSFIGLNESVKGTSGELGNAMGMNIVKDLVNNCGGLIVFKSELGEGTEVRVELPIV